MSSVTAPKRTDLVALVEVVVVVVEGAVVEVVAGTVVVAAAAVVVVVAAAVVVVVAAATVVVVAPAVEPGRVVVDRLQRLLEASARRTPAAPTPATRAATAATAVKVAKERAQRGEDLPERERVMATSSDPHPRQLERNLSKC